MLSISVDSTKPDDHDTFRKHKGAFTKATSALKMIASRESKKTYSFYENRCHARHY